MLDRSFKNNFVNDASYALTNKYNHAALALGWFSNLYVLAQGSRGAESQLTLIYILGYIYITAFNAFLFMFYICSAVIGTLEVTGTFDVMGFLNGLLANPLVAGLIGGFTFNWTVNTMMQVVRLYLAASIYLIAIVNYRHMSIYISILGSSRA